MKRLPSFIPLLIVMFSVIALWLIRWDSLTLPYFWDEMGVYGRGVQYLFEHGIGILPSSLPPEISRGHPLLFYSLHASVLKLFGNSFFTSHAFALMISSGTLAATYLLAKEVVPKLIAAGCVVLLVSQNIFLAQSGLVVPEMLIALLSTLALWAYFKEKFWLSVVLLCFGVLIKESVILVAAFIGFLYLINTLRTRSLVQNIRQLVLFTLPLVVLALFLLIQKIQHGWYFFPYHTDIVQESALSGFRQNLLDHLKFIFFKQGRFLWSLAVGLSVLSLPLIKNRKKLFVLVAFFCFNLFFFSLAFYMDRYLLYIYPVLVIIVAKGVYLLSFQKEGIAFIVLYALSALSFVEWNNTEFNYDASLAYEDVIFVHQLLIKDLCDLESGDFSCSSNFPINLSLYQASLGYIDSACRERLSSLSFVSKADYVIMFNENPPAGNYTPIGTYEKGEAFIELLKRDE